MVRGFPDSFNYANINEEKLMEARAMVLERYKKFVQAQKPYFQIDLTNYSESIRIRLITEISQKFKGIGYREKPPSVINHNSFYDLALRMLMLNDSRIRDYVNIVFPQEIKCRVIRLTSPDKAGNFTHFFIALTEQTNQELESYTWTIK